MATPPQLIEEDIQELDSVLREFLEKSDAVTALVLDKGGFLITHQGNSSQFDLTTIGALASGAYLANQTIANLVEEENFNTVYQQGEKYSMLATDIDEHCLLLVIFKAQTGVGVVKYYCGGTRERIAHQMKVAQERDPNAGLDLSVLNLADASSMFRRKD